MRKINWDQELSEEDITWLLQSGQLGMEDRISAHQARFGGVVELEHPEDTVTQSALDPSARLRGEPIPVDSAPVNLSPEPGTVQAGDALEGEGDDSDDYDNWKLAELRAEVTARNELAAKTPELTEVVVEGTGADGAVRKQDLVKALRIWDDENPGALEPQS